MRVLIFHGYLLAGTGSNVYNANLAAALVRLGHEVHLLSQERHPESLPFVDAVGEWSDGELRVLRLREPVRCTAYRPQLAGILPVYVADRYEGIEARRYPDLSEREVDDYVDANVAAVRDVAALARPDVALANHLVMGPLILARALEETPYAVKIHGSALEYTVKPYPRFLPAARAGIAPARGVLVGSRHVAESLWAALELPDLPPRTRLGPPGVDVARFVPREPPAARAGLAALAERLGRRAAAAAAAGIAAGEVVPSDGTSPARPLSSFTRDEGAAAAALASLAAGEDDRLVAFVGKLIVSKGVDLLVAAWPLVLAAEPRARLVLVGFGAYRHGVERLIDALADGDLDAVAALAAEGRAAEGDPAATGSLRYLQAFFDDLAQDPDSHASYLSAARGLRERIVLTGRLDHDELADVLPACEAQVVPSTFPEAFGMVAVEAAACGALPICADHSGLAEVAAALADVVPEDVRPWLAFPVDQGAVPAIAERVVAWLQAPEAVRGETRAALVETVRRRWSWEGVARGVIAAAEGRLDALADPGVRDTSH